MSKNKKRPNPAAFATSRKKRARRRPDPRRPVTYVVTCGCKPKPYTLHATTGETTFCVFCGGKPDRVRLETIEERSARVYQERLQQGRLVGELFRGLFGSGTPAIRSELETELLRAGYRSLAAKYHPDKGGDPAKMRELNDLKERLGL